MRIACLNRTKMSGLMSAGALVAMQSTAADWPNYRGPNHDGISTESIRTNWTAVPPQQLWKVPVGAALSSLTIKDGRVFTIERHGNTITGREFCIALDANTGAKLWERDIDLADYPHGGVGSDDGPRSTPTVDGDRVYVLGSYLQLVCMNAATGAEVWRRNLLADYGGSVITWQSAGSPTILGDNIFVATAATGNRLFAFNKNTGVLVWRQHTDTMTQSTPVPATIHGVPQIIFFTQTGLVSVNPDTGAALWRFPLSYSTSSAAAPVIDGNLVYGSAAYGRGAAVGIVAENNGTFSVSDAWRFPGDHQNHWGTPIVHNGHLYGPYGQNTPIMECINIATGESKWQRSGIGYGSVLKVGEHLLALHADGTMVLIRFNTTNYDEIDRFRPLTGKCWNNPAVSNGRIYLRSTLEVAAFDVVIPRTEFAADAGVMTPQGFQLTIGSHNGAPLDAARAANISVFHAADPATPPANWSLLNQSGTLFEGNLIIIDTGANGAPVRYYRAEENP